MTATAISSRNSSGASASRSTSGPPYRYACSHSLQSGTLFVGRRSVAFQSNQAASGGRERLISVALTDVSDLSGGDTDDALCVTTASGEFHVFTDLGGMRDGALRRLGEARDAALAAPLPPPGEDGDGGGDEWAEVLSAAPPAPGLKRSNSMPSTSQRSVAAPPLDEEGDAIWAALSDFSNIAYSIQRMKAMERARTESERFRDRGRMNEQFTKSIAFFGDVARKKGRAELRKDWDGLKKSNDKVISNVAVSDFKLPCDLDTFYKKFWSTSATHPISHYQRHVIGDKDIKTGEWDETLDDFTLERVIDYMHPSDAPMGPPMAHSKKSQQVQRYGKHGIVLQTVTQVEDVPMADCFVLEDRIMVEPFAKGEVVMTAQYGIRFVKSTMWKKIIQKNAKGGIKKWLVGYSDFMKEAFEK